MAAEEPKEPPLFQAVRDTAKKDAQEDAVELVRSLVAKKDVDINATDKYDNSVLSYAKTLEVVKLLVEANADFEQDSWTPIMTASRDGLLDVVTYLVEQGANVNAGIDDPVNNKYDWNAVQMAARNDKLDVVRYLVEHGFEINRRGYEGATGLVSAIKHEKWRVARYLLDQKADPNIATSGGQNALHCAIQKGCMEYVRELKPLYEPPEALFIQTNDLMNVKQLSSGNFGITYRGEMVISRQMEEPVTIECVIKVPRFAAGQDDWYELAVLKNVPKHKNVLPLLGMCMNFYFEGKTRLGIAVPFKHGGSVYSHLRERKRECPLSLNRLVKFGLDMCFGIQHLHIHSYHHNDIAARNFLLQQKEPIDGALQEEEDTKQRLVIADFGLSRPLQQQDNEADDAAAPVRPWRWIAPETITSRGKMTNIATDVWMLGVAFWELCGLNTVPFHYISNVTQLLKMFQAERHALHVFPRLFAEDWKNVVKMCCTCNPEDRPGIGDVIKTLQEIMQHEKLGIAPPAEVHEAALTIDELSAADSVAEYAEYSEFSLGDTPVDYSDVPSEYQDISGDEDDAEPQESKQQKGCQNYESVAAPLPPEQKHSESSDSMATQKDEIPAADSGDVDPGYGEPEEDRHSKLQSDDDESGSEAHEYLYVDSDGEGAGQDIYSQEYQEFQDQKEVDHYHSLDRDLAVQNPEEKNEDESQFSDDKWRSTCPEVLQNPDLIGPETDVYSLGILFCELIAGSKFLPFRDIQNKKDFLECLDSDDFDIGDALTSSISKDVKIENLERWKELICSCSRQHKSQRTSLQHVLQELRTWKSECEEKHEIPIPVEETESDDENEYDKPDKSNPPAGKGKDGPPENIVDAAKRGFRDELLQYLKDGADPNETIDYTTAANEAAHCGRVEIFEDLLFHKADINIQNSFKMTPLINAASNGHLDILKLCLENNADISVRDISGWHALGRAIEGGHTEVAKVLIEQKADVNNRDTGRGYSNLHSAVDNNSVEIVKELIKCEDFDPYCLDQQRVSALLLACQKGHYEIAKMILTSFPDYDLNLGNTYEMNPLFVSLYRNKPKCAKLLLRHGADATYTRDTGQIPLDTALEKVPSVVDVLRRAHYRAEARFFELSELRNVEPIMIEETVLIFHADWVVSTQKKDEESLFIPVICKLPRFGSSEGEWFELEFLQNVPDHECVSHFLGACMDFKYKQYSGVALVMAGEIPKGHVKLHDYLAKKESVSFSEALHFAIDVTSSLLHIHSCNYVHNDVSSRAFMVQERYPNNTSGKEKGVKALMSGFRSTRPCQIVDDPMTIVKAKESNKKRPLTLPPPEDQQQEGCTTQ